MSATFRPPPDTAGSGELAEAEALLSSLATVFFPEGSETLTENSTAEEPRLDLEGQYRLLLEQIPAVLFIAYLDGGTGDAYVSPQVERMLGFTHREWLEEPVRWYRQIHPDDRARWSIDAAHFFLSGEPLRALYRVIAECGRVVWFQCEAKMVRRPDGRPLLVHGVGFDVSDLKQTEESLTEAMNAAQAANRAKSEFLANMSHEIRTPINGIMGMTELALGTELTPEQGEYLRTVQTSADALLSVVNDILDFSKIEAKKLEFETIDFNVRQCIEETMTLLRVRAHEKGLELTCDVPPGLHENLVGDPGRLRQVLVNLIGNAIKFTEAGYVALRVETDAQTDSDAVFHFHVIDTGVGIPPDKQKLIFDAFSQADSSSTRKYGGTGLGLTISSQLVEMMGGRIWVESEPGRGSVFHFTARLPFSSNQPAATDAALLRDARVLVVDDSAVNLRILNDMLIHWGAHPTCVEGAEAALHELRLAKQAAKPFALILTDGQMPEKDGFMLIEAIRQEPDLAGAAIMMLSSTGQREDAERCRRLGISGYLTKPVRQADLLDAIRHALDGTKAALPVARKSAGRSKRTLRILLAEDNAVNQKVATRMLERLGHQVQVAANGLQALNALEREAFDLVLMDLQMPVMGGFEATEAIRARERADQGRIPIVALTAHAMKGDREKCLSAGMDDYITKPIIPKELFRVIEALD